MHLLGFVQPLLVWSKVQNKGLIDDLVTYLAGFFGGRCVEAGGGHGVHLQEGPHGPQEPLMPQEQGCHLTLCVFKHIRCMLRV